MEIEPTISIFRGMCSTAEHPHHHSFERRSVQNFNCSLQELGSADDSSLAVDALMEKFPVAFANLAEKVHSAAFTAWASSAHPEEKVPTDLWENDSSITNEVRAMHHLVMVKTFRQDRLVAAAKKFASVILGGSFDYVAEKELDLVSNPRSIGLNPGANPM